MSFWSRIIVNALLFIALTGFFPNSFYVDGILTALVASLVLTILNALVKPILYILSLPITILTLGLFSIVINAAMLQLTAFFVGSGFQIASFWTSIWMAIILSIANTVITNHFSRTD